jgi:hypothetical protein
VTPLPTTPCDESAKARSKNGYHVVSHDGRLWSHHRWTWEQAHGPVPDGLVVMHLCDNRSCIRLDHLALGTQAENLAMACERGSRTPPDVRGEEVGTHKLTEEEVRDIRDRWDAGESKRALGREFGVSATNIGYVVRRESWKHVA